MQGSHVRGPCLSTPDHYQCLLHQHSGSCPHCLLDVRFVLWGLKEAIFANTSLLSVYVWRYLFLFLAFSEMNTFFKELSADKCQELLIIVMEMLRRMSACKCRFCVAAWLLGCCATWDGMRVTCARWYGVMLLCAHMHGMLHVRG